MCSECAAQHCFGTSVHGTQWADHAEEGEADRRLTATDNFECDDPKRRLEFSIKPGKTPADEEVEACAKSIVREVAKTTVEWGKNCVKSTAEWEPQWSQCDGVGEDRKFAVIFCSDRTNKQEGQFADLLKDHLNNTQLCKRTITQTSECSKFFDIIPDTDLEGDTCSCAEMARAAATVAAVSGGDIEHPSEESGEWIVVLVVVIILVIVSIGVIVCVVRMSRSRHPASKSATRATIQLRPTGGVGTPQSGMFFNPL